MASISLLEDLNNKVFEGTKYRIGDRVRVVQAKGAENYPDETKRVLLESVGNVYEVTDVDAWETEDVENPYWISYRLEVTDEDTIFMDEDELEPA